MSELIKLHLGCYHRKIHGYINIDIRPECSPDLVEDCFLLSSFKNNSVDVIYTCHMLEHCKRDEVLPILIRWNEILKPGGILRISVPDFEALCEYYIQTRDLEAITNLMFGSQKHAYDFHYIGFNEKYLTSLLKGLDFVNIHRYDWRETEHFYIDDYSQCYLPSIEYKSRRLTDEIKGKLVSLNIEAVKALSI